MGFAQLKTYIRLLLFMGQPSPIESIYPLTISRMTNLHGMVFGLFGSKLPPSWIAAITMILSAALLLYLAAQRLSGSDALLYALTASTALSYYLFFHDISALFLPITITLDRFLLAEWDPDSRKIVILAAALFVLPLLLSYAPGFLYLTTFPLIGLLLVWKPSSLADVAAKAQELAPDKAGPGVV
jgi:hypothetical protein